jgi:energy-coupling factor transport system substrate-specific component
MNGGFDQGRRGSSGGFVALWSTRDIVVAAVLSVVVGVVFWGWGLLWSAFFQAIPFPSSYFVVGMWMVGGVLVPYVIRKPGAAVVGEVAAAFVSMLLVNQWGAWTMVSGVVQGVGAELVFALFLYRRYPLGVLLLAGAVAGFLSLVLDTFVYGYYQAFVFSAIAAAAGISALSGAVLGGGLSKLLGDALERTGVLSGLAIARAKQAERAARIAQREDSSGVGSLPGPGGREG